MERTHILYLLLPVSLMLISMDDDIYNVPQEVEQTDYVFPPLLATHVYPIRIYEWYSGHKRQRPLCGDKKDFVKYRKAAKYIEVKYDNAVRDLRDKRENNVINGIVEEKHLITKRICEELIYCTAECPFEVVQDIGERIHKINQLKKDDIIDAIVNEKKDLLIALREKHKKDFGKIFIYNAINKAQRFQNPWYCVAFLKSQAVVSAEMACAKTANSTFYTKSDKYKYTCVQPALSLKQKQECDDTLELFMKFIATPDAMLHISFPAYYYAKSQGATEEGLRKKFYVLEHGECPMVSWQSSEFDLERLYNDWPEHETKDTIRKLIDQNTIPFTPFFYNASPSSSPEESSPLALREAEVQSVYTYPNSTNSHFLNSTIYKLQ